MTSIVGSTLSDGPVNVLSDIQVFSIYSSLLQTIHTTKNRYKKQGDFPAMGVKYPIHGQTSINRIVTVL